MGDIPQMVSPWPDPRRWAVTRRLFAAWRWEREAHELAATNARRSVLERTARLVASGGAGVF